MPLEIDAEIFRAVVSTIVPESVDLDGQGWRDLDLVVEGLLRDRPENLQGQLRLFLRFIQWLPVLRFGRKDRDSSRKARSLDLLLVNGDPVTDISHIADPAKNGDLLRVILLRGRHISPGEERSTGRAGKYQRR